MEGNSLYPHFSLEELSRRHKAVRAALAEADLAALIACGTPGSDSEVQYLSNFLVSREAMLIFPVEGEPALFVQYFNHLPIARKLAMLPDVRWGGADTLASVIAHVREQGLEAQRLGIVGPLSLQRLAALQQALPQATLVDFSTSLLYLRLVKSQEEFEFMRKGAAFSDRAIEALAQQVRPGIPEYELAAIVEGAYLGLGGKTHIHYMATTSMQNPSICVPAQQLSSRVLEKGDVLITEISAAYHGYAGQILRPFAIGTAPTAEYQRLYDVAFEVFERITNLLRAGTTSEEILDAAEYVHAQGFTIYDDLVHGFGPGTYYPSLRTRRTSAGAPQAFTFRENMAVVVQPNIITEDERMGVQLGELMRVTRNGVEPLHTYPRRFIRCG
jgi:Xaa-Pro aminopeptidase